MCKYHCKSVTETQINEAIISGYSTVSSLQLYLGVHAQCIECAGSINKAIMEHRNKNITGIVTLEQLFYKMLDMRCTQYEEQDKGLNWEWCNKEWKPVSYEYGIKHVFDTWKTDEFHITKHDRNIYYNIETPSYYEEEKIIRNDVWTIEYLNLNVIEDDGTLLGKGELKNKLTGYDNFLRKIEREAVDV